ncbi:cytidine deaminase-like protein [Clohesyomyces aquaticus]|uniref:Deoxycytidylate deaminase n=1 Tax=Clohesyomyces aquaticus TaxID=1231657 RepID=A0A1Y1Z000_9PLEO|nr:cytidine deaminase-like protein [Clohesyomyces aquaticus]
MHLVRTSTTPAVEKSANDAHVPSTDAEGEFTFPNVDALLEFVTLRWQEPWVTTDVWDEGVVDALLRRPFFLLVSVDAPVSVRWQRFQARCTANQLTPPSLEQFVLRNDAHLFAPGTGLGALIQRAQLKLLNSTTSISSLYTALGSLSLTDEARLRPSWDQYFMQLADLAAHRSNCMKRRVGCVIAREKRVISTGYNGTPRGMTNCNEGGCPRCNNASRAGADLSTCLCLHAEENALLEAGRDRIGEGSILYCNTCPCLTCSVKITQVGISEVVYNQGYLVDTKTAEIFAEGGVKLRQFTPPTGGLVDLSLVTSLHGRGASRTSGAPRDGAFDTADIRATLDDESYLRPI